LFSRRIAVGVNFEGRSQEPEEMAANQEQSVATFYRHTTEMLEILEEFDADLENEITENVKEMQGSYSEVNQTENDICDNYEKLENLRSPVEELLEKLEAIEKKWEEIRKQQEERDAKTRQEKRKKQKPDWNKIKKKQKKRIDKVYIGIEVECKFLRNFNIDTWFAIKPLIEDNGVYIGIQVPCKFLRKTFKLGV